LSLTKREVFILAALAVLLLLGAFLRSGGLWRSQDEIPVASEGEKENADAIEDADADEDENNLLYVDVAGAVKNPGVISLPEESRVYRALDKVGLKDDADVERINRARPLVDGEKLLIPYEGENESEAPENTVSLENGEININRADLRDLTELSGIGEVRAQSILDYREEHGPFQDISEIQEVSGIGTATFENIRDDITVY